LQQIIEHKSNYTWHVYLSVLTICGEHKRNCTWYISIFVPDVKNANQIVLDVCHFCTRYGEHKLITFHICQFCTRYGEHKPIFTWYMSLLHQIWRKQAKLYLIRVYVSFTPDLENTSQIIFDICQFCTRYGQHKPNCTWYMSILNQIWRKQAKLYLINVYVSFTPDSEKTSQIIFDLCQFCTRYGVHKPLCNWYMSILIQMWRTQAKLYLIRLYVSLHQIWRTHAKL